jgi:hypothetical protein
MRLARHRQAGGLGAQHVEAVAQHMRHGKAWPLCNGLRGQRHRIAAIAAQRGKPDLVVPDLPGIVESTNRGTTRRPMGNGNRPTPEFRREAVRLALTSGRTRQEIAEDLGIGLSTLTRWPGQKRDTSEPSEDPVDLHAATCRRQQQDMVHLAHIRTAFALSSGTCGSPRMQRDLADDGHQIGRHRAARLMRENQLIEHQERRFNRTTDSEHAWPVAPDLEVQDFTPDGPDRKWGADISYIWAEEGWL